MRRNSIVQRKMIPQRSVTLSPSDIPVPIREVAEGIDVEDVELDISNFLRPPLKHAVSVPH